MRIVTGIIKSKDHWECRNCAFPLGPGERAYYTTEDEGPFCTRVCAREFLEPQTQTRNDWVPQHPEMEW